MPSGGGYIINAVRIGNICRGWLGDGWGRAVLLGKHLQNLKKFFLPPAIKTDQYLAQDRAY